MRRALALDEKNFGADHPSVAMRLNDLAQMLQDTNRYAESEPLFRRALAIDEKSFGTDHPNVAIRLNNLAHLLEVTNRLAESEPLYRRALAIDEKSFGTDHPNVARDLNNLARLLAATNRLAESEPLFRRALASDEKSFGTDHHPSVAKDLNNLGHLLEVTNRLTESEPLYRRALIIDEKFFGVDNISVAIDLDNLASILQATNRLAESEPLLRRSLLIFYDFSRSTGQEHSSFKTVRARYTSLLEAMGKTPAQIKPPSNPWLTLPDKKRCLCPGRRSPQPRKLPLSALDQTQALNSWGSAAPSRRAGPGQQAIMCSEGAEDLAAHLVNLTKKHLDREREISRERQPGKLVEVVAYPERAVTTARASGWRGLGVLPRRTLRT